MEIYSALLLKIEKEVSLEVASSLRRRTLFESGVLNQAKVPPELVQQMFDRPISTARPVSEREWPPSALSSARPSFASAPPVLESTPAAETEHQAEEPGKAPEWTPLIARSIIPLFTQQTRASSKDGKAWRLGAIRSGELEHFEDAGPLPLWMLTNFNTTQDFGPTISQSRSSPHLLSLPDEEKSRSSPQWMASGSKLQRAATGIMRARSDGGREAKCVQTSCGAKDAQRDT